QIALNLCRDWGRRPPPEPVDPASIPAPVVEHSDRDAALDVERLLSALPEEQRAAVVLRYCHDLPEDEVAVILDIPRGTVKSRLRAAVRRLVALAREPRGRPCPATSSSTPGSGAAICRQEVPSIWPHARRASRTRRS